VSREKEREQEEEKRILLIIRSKGETGKRIVGDEPSPFLPEKKKGRRGRRRITPAARRGKKGKSEWRREDPVTRSDIPSFSGKEGGERGKNQHCFRFFWRKQGREASRSVRLNNS